MPPEHAVIRCPPNDVRLRAFPRHECADSAVCGKGDGHGVIAGEVGVATLARGHIDELNPSAARRDEEGLADADKGNYSHDRPTPGRRDFRFPHLQKRPWKILSREFVLPSESAGLQCFLN
jgi:hypothetical protein